jgi:hypothetical protein
MTGHQTEIAQLQATVETLKSELDTLKKIIANPTPLSADAYPQLLTNPAPVNQILAVPLSKVIDLYRECPQILEPVARRVALDKEHFSLDGNAGAQPLSFHVNPNGNFWVIQLLDQGHYLFPRPSDFKRIARLSYLDKIFATKRENNSDTNEFDLKKPAKLKVLKIQENWRLEQEGLIVYGSAPLHYEWQKELDSIRQDYQTFNQHLEKCGDAALDFTLTAQRWQQTLQRKYGPLMCVTVNTCMPIAYAVYRGPVLVPCQLLMSHKPKPIVVPGWDKGIDWETSIYAKFHSTRNTDLFQTPHNHPVLPNQIYLREINWETNHTWAIAKSYPEASAILEKLIDNWGSLDKLFE